MAQEKMEIDLELPPNSTTTDSNALRRANSVPLINGFGDNSQVFQADTLRVKRNSATFMSQHALLFLPSSLRTSASRLHQIKQEEGMDIVNREAMHEREVHTAIQISQSWEKSLNLNDDDLEKPSALNSIDLIPVSQAASITKWIGKIFSNDHDGFILEVTGPPTLLKQVSLDHKKEKGKIPLDDQTKRFSKETTNIHPVTLPSCQQNLSPDIPDESNSIAGSSSCNSLAKISKNSPLSPCDTGSPFINVDFN